MCVGWGLPGGNLFPGVSVAAEWFRTGIFDRHIPIRAAAGTCHCALRSHNRVEALFSISYLVSGNVPSFQPVVLYVDLLKFTWNGCRCANLGVESWFGRWERTSDLQIFGERGRSTWLLFPGEFAWKYPPFSRRFCVAYLVPRFVLAAGSGQLQVYLFLFTQTEDLHLQRNGTKRRLLGSRLGLRCFFFLLGGSCHNEKVQYDRVVQAQLWFPKV